MCDVSGGGMRRSSAAASSSASRSVSVSTRCASASIAQIPVACSTAQRAWASASASSPRRYKAQAEKLATPISSCTAERRRASLSMSSHSRWSNPKASSPSKVTMIEADALGRGGYGSRASTVSTRRWVSSGGRACLMSACAMTTSTRPGGSAYSARLARSRSTVWKAAGAVRSSIRPASAAAPSRRKASRRSVARIRATARCSSTTAMSAWSEMMYAFASGPAAAAIADASGASFSACFRWPIASGSPAAHSAVPRRRSSDGRCAGAAGSARARRR